MNKNLKISKESHIIVATLAFMLIIFLPALFFRIYYNNSIYSFDSVNSIEESYEYGIVLGAGTNKEGEPNQVLEDRLDSAENLYSKGKIEKIVLSGNNDSIYKEVDAMREYLIVKKGVNKEDLLLDGYGYRTYDTCKRSSEVYDISKAIVITSNYHLPRALYLCESAGVDSIGAAGRKDFYMGSFFYIGREVLATHKALIDTLISPPGYNQEVY